MNVRKKVIPAYRNKSVQDRLSSYLRASLDDYSAAIKKPWVRSRMDTFCAIFGSQACYVCLGGATFAVNENSPDTAERAFLENDSVMGYVHAVNDVRSGELHRAIKSFYKRKGCQSKRIEEFLEKNSVQIARLRNKIFKEYNVGKGLAPISLYYKTADALYEMGL